MLGRLLRHIRVFRREHLQRVREFDNCEGYGFHFRYLFEEQLIVHKNYLVWRGFKIISSLFNFATLVVVTEEIHINILRNGALSYYLYPKIFPKDQWRYHGKIRAAAVKDSMLRVDYLAGSAGDRREETLWLPLRIIGSDGDRAVFQKCFAAYLADGDGLPAGAFNR